MSRRLRLSMNFDSFFVQNTYQKKDYFPEHELVILTLNAIRELGIDEGILATCEGIAYYYVYTGKAPEMDVIFNVFQYALTVFANKVEEYLEPYSMENREERIREFRKNKFENIRIAYIQTLLIYEKYAFNLERVKLQI